MIIYRVSVSLVLHMQTKLRGGGMPKKGAHIASELVHTRTVRILLVVRVSSCDRPFFAAFEDDPRDTLCCLFHNIHNHKIKIKIWGDRFIS